MTNADVVHQHQQTVGGHVEYNFVEKYFPRFVSVTRNNPRQRGLLFATDFAFIYKRPRALDDQLDEMSHNRELKLNINISKFWFEIKIDNFGKSAASKVCKY